MRGGQLTVFGPGLIGGSVAKAARRAGLFERYVAIDRRGIASGEVFDAWIPSSDDAAVRAAYRASNLVVLATPVHSIIDELPRALDEANLVTDCGSTKCAIVEATSSHPRRAHFVPSHPMAGLPEGGLSRAREDLFDGRTWLICGEASAPPLVRTLEDCVTALGARVTHLSAAEHDRSVAITSHVPQVFASALLHLATTERALGAAGPGFASSTRVAGGAEAMWADIFHTNGPEIGRALRLLATILDGIGQDLEGGESASALRILELARLTRNS